MALRSLLPIKLFELRRALRRAFGFAVRLDKSDRGSRGRNNNLRQALENHKAIGAARMQARMRLVSGRIEC